MFDKIYSIVGYIETLISLVLLGKYIYFEKFFKGFKAWCYFFEVFLFCQIIGAFILKSEDVQFILTLFFFCLLVFLTRKKHKIRGLFLVLPISGIVGSVIMVLISFQYLFSPSMNNILDSDIPFLRKLLDFLFLIILILFLWKGKEKVRRYDEIINNRALSKWERNLINTCGMFLFLFSCLVACIDDLNISTLYAKCLAGLGIFMVVFLDASIIAMVIQGNGKNYFQQSADLNEHYLKAQLQHFNTYQETQRETRRVHHDMKNHIHCLHKLLSQGRNDEAKRYILDLDSQIQQIDKELHTGNDIVDAIVNEKYVNSKKDQIAISIEGKLEHLPIAAIDLCTIFSNAMDNAMEALKDSSVPERKIEIKFKRQNDMQFLMFRNPVERVKSNLSFLTTKKDFINHGFGLGNIRMAVEKYNGQMEYYLENDGDEQYFILEIILFVHSTT